MATTSSFDELVGLGWLSGLDSRKMIDRGRPWAAEYWISVVRDQSLALACLRLGEPTAYARGFDRLPSETTAPYERALVRSLGRDELAWATDGGEDYELLVTCAADAFPRIAV